MLTSLKSAGISPRAIAHGVKATVLKSAPGALHGTGLLTNMFPDGCSSRLWY
jgi:hypothetical protein